MTEPSLSDPCRHCAHTRYSHKDASPESRGQYPDVRWAEDIPDGRCWALRCTCSGFELAAPGTLTIGDLIAGNAVSAASMRERDRQIEAVEGRPAEYVRALESDRPLQLEDIAATRAQRLELEPSKPRRWTATGADRVQELIDYMQTTTLEERTRIRLELERMYPRTLQRENLIEQGYRGRMVQGLPTPREVEALAFCFDIALEHNHGGAIRIRKLLFAWHNAAELGGFDFADLWSLDETYRAHALALIGLIARSPVGWYAEHYGYEADMIAIIDTYGPAKR